MSSPEQKAKFALTKKKQDSSRIHFLYPDVSSVFRKDFQLLEGDVLNAS